MKLRPPAVPLITVDPYFSVWSLADRLTDTETCHWTEKPNTLIGIAEIDGTPYRFIGADSSIPAMEQVSLDVTALETVYRFRAGGIILTASFMTPLFPDDYEHLTRPVSYLELYAESEDAQPHHVQASISASEEFCLDCRGQMETETTHFALGTDISCAGIGGKEQAVLARKGDDIRIDWGRFYLAVCGGSTDEFQKDGMKFLRASADLAKPALFAFAYDDIESITYFGQNLRSWWNRNGKTIEQALTEAFADYPECRKQAEEFSSRLYREAEACGGEKYAELLSLAYRQVMAAHKLVLDTDGKLLYISKECFSNGCAATADVSYPSIPMYLYYNPELIKGMMRPIFRYAASPAWPFDFAPHDAGTYPILNGQVYSGGTDPKDQMPVEECGNMLLMAAAVSVVEHDASFAQENMELLEKWASYLMKHGVDPENQLCTDDFAGHLAHNCNLSLKSIMALEGMSLIKKLLGEDGTAFHQAAVEMTHLWLKNAANGDGSYRLAFDRPDTFSMKYNVIWDKLFETGLFPKESLDSEFASYRRHFQPYGLPLDNRETYTKSDWLVWTACFAPSKEEFESFIAPLWKAYHESSSRVPMTDWYQTTDARQMQFQHRTVQGGLFLKLLLDSGKCSAK